VFSFILQNAFICRGALIVPTELTAKNIIVTATFVVLVYSVAQPFRLLIDKLLERKISE